MTLLKNNLSLLETIKKISFFNANAINDKSQTQLTTIDIAKYLICFLENINPELISEIESVFIANTILSLKSKAILEKLSHPDIFHNTHENKHF